MIKPGHGVYVHVIKGEITIGATILQSGDAIGMYEAQLMAIQARQRSELIF
jgi:hypothetical protein